MAYELIGLCSGLHAGAGAATTRPLLDLVWRWAAREIDTALASSSPSNREQALATLARPLAALLTAAAAVTDTGILDAVTDQLRHKGDAVTGLGVSALRAAAELPDHGTRGAADFADLAADCAAQLRLRLTQPSRAPGDWSIELPTGGCSCDLCDTLRTYLADPDRRTFEWPLAEQGRKHVHSRLGAGELPVSHTTRRQGRPYALVLHKTDALFTREVAARARDQEDLEWLTATWGVGR